jgi:hypothetical protein
MWYCAASIKCSVSNVTFYSLIFTHYFMTSLSSDFACVWAGIGKKFELIINIVQFLPFWGDVTIFLLVSSLLKRQKQKKKNKKSGTFINCWLLCAYFMLLSIWQFLISFTYYNDYKHNLPSIVNKFEIQFKFISDPSSNIREGTR